MRPSSPASVARRSSTCAKRASGSRATSTAPSSSPKSYVEQEIEGEAPDHDRPIVLYCAGGVRSLFAAETLQDMGYTNVASMSGGFQALEDRGPRLLDAGRPERGAEAALLATSAHPGGRSRGPGAAAGLEGAPHRRGRTWVAGDALPRGRGCGHARRRRLRRGGPLEPPAAGRPHDRPDRAEEDGVGGADDRGAQPGRPRRPARGDARRRERRPAHRGLRRHPRRHRHVRDALHAQRRGRSCAASRSSMPRCSASRAS